MMLYPFQHYVVNQVKETGSYHEGTTLTPREKALLDELVLVGVLTRTGVGLGYVQGENFNA